MPASICLVVIENKPREKDRCVLGKINFYPERKSSNRVYPNNGVRLKLLPDDMKHLEKMFNNGNKMFDPMSPNVTGGLTSTWEGDVCFVNPKTNPKLWLKKSLEEAKKGKKVVLLIPARTNAHW